MKSPNIKNHHHCGNKLEEKNFYALIELLYDFAKKDGRINKYFEGKDMSEIMQKQLMEFKKILGKLLYIFLGPKSEDNQLRDLVPVHINMTITHNQFNAFMENFRFAARRLKVSDELI